MIANWKHLQKNTGPTEAGGRSPSMDQHSHSEITLSREDKKKRENGAGRNVSSTMNWGFPAGHRGTLVTLETERADKCQFNTGSNRNTSRLDGATLP